MRLRTKMKSRAVLMLCTVPLIVNTLSLAGCTEYNTSNDPNKLVTNIDADVLKDDQREALEQFLISQGLDPDLANERTKTEGGATILGNAKPVIEYRTLHDAETAYGSYFGFHNTIDSLPDYELVGMYNVNNEFIQGIYTNETDSSTVLVKFSKTSTLESLREPYNKREFTKLVIVDVNEGVKATIEGDAEDSINLMMMSFINGKNYTIYSPNPLTADQAKKVCKELSDNVTSMEDWIK